jgi:hypothetical protein
LKRNAREFGVEAASEGSVTALSPIASLLAALTVQLQAPPAADAERGPEFVEFLAAAEVPEVERPPAKEQCEAEMTEDAPLVFGVPLSVPAPPAPPPPPVRATIELPPVEGAPVETAVLTGETSAVEPIRVERLVPEREEAAVVPALPRAEEKSEARGTRRAAAELEHPQAAPRESEGGARPVVDETAASPEEIVFKMPERAGERAPDRVSAGAVPETTAVEPGATVESPAAELHASAPARAEAPRTAERRRIEHHTAGMPVRPSHLEERAVHVVATPADGNAAERVKEDVPPPAPAENVEPPRGGVPPAAPSPAPTVVREAAAPAQVATPEATPRPAPERIERRRPESRPPVIAADRRESPAATPREAPRAVQPAEPTTGAPLEASRPRLAFSARLTPSPMPAERAERQEPARSDHEAPKGEAQTAREAAAGWSVAPREAVAPERSEAPDTRVEAKTTEVKTAAPRRASPLPAPVARDIRLEVGDPERKVEVRVVERAGEVRVAVRTPDDRLADGLREQLPSLSSRLEQSGYRADEWRVAAGAGGERRIEVEAAAAGSADARQHGQPQERGQERRDGEPRPHHDPDEESRRQKEKGSQFSWLMESLP